MLVDCNLPADWLFQEKLLIFMYGNLVLNVMTKKCSDAGKSISSLKTIFIFSLDNNNIIIYVNLLLPIYLVKHCCNDEVFNLTTPFCCQHMTSLIL